MQKTYHGSCICKAIAFEADIDLSQGAHRCNCTSCRKTRTWSATIKPAQFRWTKGENSVALYPAQNGLPGAYRFCPTCGVRFGGAGYLEEMGGDYVTVAIATLDDATPEELIAAPLHWLDGLNNNWFNSPAETRYL